MKKKKNTTYKTWNDTNNKVILQPIYFSMHHGHFCIILEWKLYSSGRWMISAIITEKYVIAASTLPADAKFLKLLPWQLAVYNQKKTEAVLFSSCEK